MRKLLREDLDKVREMRPNVHNSISYQLLLKAWSSSTEDSTQDAYHVCALDILARPDVYSFESCTTGLSLVNNIMNRRGDELDILNGHAYFNITLSNKTYNKPMLDRIEHMSVEEKKERTDTLCDPKFLIKEILANTTR